MSERQDDLPKDNSNPMSVSRLPAEEALQFSAPAPQIEGYQILEKLGEAGQGQVWRAVQLSTGQQAALKVPRIGLLSSKKTLARFEREVEIAAQLKHPHIARIIDSGVHRGLYFYTMDLIEGKHLDQYVKDSALSHRQILELMKVICEAVQHAHQNGVIHRDLKPSNILVTPDGHPFIVDFGLARALQADSPAITVSVDGEAAGTPAFMSPEQAAGHADQIDTRTDVYSLGAILFMLLTGRHPHDLSGSHLDVLRRIAEGEVIRPRTLAPRIDRDLEALLLKALEHNPDRRYPSAAGLAEDIDHYLHGLPLSATPRSHMRRMGSFVRRHRVGVALGLLTSAMGLAAVVILAASTILISQEKQRAENALGREQQALGQETRARTEAERARATEEQARAEAQRQARIAQAVADFLNNDLLASVDPATARGRQATVREILDAASQKIEGKFTDEPLIEASIRQTLGNTYMGLGEYARAGLHLERARRLHQERSQEDPSSLSVVSSLCRLYVSRGWYKEAEALLVRNLETSTQILGKEHLGTLGCMLDLASLYHRQSRYQEAESLNVITLEISKRVFGEEHACTLEAMRGVAALCREQGRHQEAEALYRQILDTEVRRLGEEHPDTLRSMSNLAIQWQLQGEYQEAMTLYLRTAGAMQRVLGEEHPDTLRCLSGLAEVYAIQGRYQQAESLLLNSCQIGERVLGKEHPDSLDHRSRLATLYCRMGRYQEAEALYLSTVETAKRVLGDEHRDTVDTLRLLTELYQTWGRPEEARKWRAQLPQEATAPTTVCEIPRENLTIPEDLRVCADHLRDIHKAVMQYEEVNGVWPNWLSDLVPDYLDSAVLLCPNDLARKASYAPDPRPACSYSWEFSPNIVPEGWDPTGRTLYRDWKRQQAEFFGTVVPMIRCVHHGNTKVLNVSMAGQVYLSPLDWEYMFKRDYRFGDKRPIQAFQAAAVELSPVRDLPDRAFLNTGLPERRQITASGRKASWSPDGNRIVFGKPSKAGLRILDLATGQAADVTISGTDPAWSPDGRFIAYVDGSNSDAGQSEDVWLVTSAGAAPRELLEGGHPSWSQDATAVVGLVFRTHSRQALRPTG